jgi:hypothetical protein
MGITRRSLVPERSGGVAFKNCLDRRLKGAVDLVCCICGVDRLVGEVGV